MELLILSFSQLIAGVLLAIVVYNIGLTIYRLYLDPLAKFPGPKFAAASRWYEFYHDIITPGRFIWHINKLHEQYGPIVRISPHEIAIKDPEFYDELYGSNTRKRDKWPIWTAATAAATSVVGTVDHDHHRRRRSALNPFFSKKNVLSHVPQAKEMVTRFLGRLNTCKANNEIIRLDAAFSALTMDIITRFAFGQDYEKVNAPDFSIGWRDAMVGTVAGAAFLRQFPWMYPVVQAMPLRIVEALNPNMGMMIRWQRIVRNDVDHIIALNQDGKRAEGTIFQEILDSDLPPSEKVAQRLEDEANVVVGAGSETTARCLSIAAFFLMTDRPKLDKLRAELRTLQKEDDGFFALAQLEQLPYLTACIMECVRMQCGVIGRLPRVSREPLQYKDWVIPPGAVFSINNYVVCYDPDIFPNPLEYRPERWIEAQQNNVRLDRYMVSFGRGTRSCIGINLAWVELYITLAHTVMNFDFEIYDTTAETDVHIDRDVFVGEPKIESKGIRVRVKDVS